LVTTREKGNQNVKREGRLNSGEKEEAQKERNRRWRMFWRPFGKKIERVASCWGEKEG